MIKYELVFKCKWCGKYFRKGCINSEIDLDNFCKIKDYSNYDNIIHHCFGDGERYGVAELVGFKKVEEQEDNKENNGISF